MAAGEEIGGGWPTRQVPPEDRRFTMADPSKKKTGSEPEITRDQGGEEQIRVRAYQFYELRGKEDGHDVEDWLRAEEELLRQTRGVAA